MLLCRPSSGCSGGSARPNSGATGCSLCVGPGILGAHVDENQSGIAQEKLGVAPGGGVRCGAREPWAWGLYVAQGCA